MTTPTRRRPTAAQKRRAHESHAVTMKAINYRAAAETWMLAAAEVGELIEACLEGLEPTEETELLKMAIPEWCRLRCDFYSALQLAQRIGDA